jgi:mycofactocin precursor
VTGDTRGREVRPIVGRCRPAGWGGHLSDRTGHLAGTAGARWVRRRPVPNEEIPVENETVEAVAPATPDTPAPAVEADLLVEDVSIDGMCGVY